MEKVIGFIGGGNMGGAMIGGIVESKVAPAEKIIVSGPHIERINKFKEKYGVVITTDNIELAKKADIIFLAVKPNIYPVVIEEIKNYIKENSIIVTIAAGQTIESVEKLFGREVKLVRTMPNTPALVGEGISAICANSLVSKDELAEIQDIFNSFGKAEVVPEELFHTVIGVSGSSPAYVYMFIEAMADAAVKGGMARNQAYKFAAQSVLGSAKMVLETGMHPGQLKDMVTSPGGTTIEAVAELEKQGMRNAVISAIDVCIEKSKNMTRE